jgi:hypothetical protein
MPLDHIRHLQARIVITFWQQALSSSDIAVLFRERMMQWREEMSTRLEQARADDEVSADVDIAVTVDELMAMLMGLQALAVLTPEDATPERQLAQLDVFFSRLRN